ncbi:MAG: hypothetical protein E6Q66_06810 [Pedobacter sp.]|jgi:hypothetical protein|nr:MAG: hypothetical protein E6Q66_06810 [Pedobacter sp.]
MHLKNLKENTLIQKLNANELQKQNGGQYFKPSIDGSMLLYNYPSLPIGDHQLGRRTKPNFRPMRAGGPKQ